MKPLACLVLHFYYQIMDGLTEKAFVSLQEQGNLETALCLLDQTLHYTIATSIVRCRYYKSPVSLSSRLALQSFGLQSFGKSYTLLYKP